MQAWPAGGGDADDIMLIPMPSFRELGLKLREGTLQSAWPKRLAKTMRNASRAARIDKISRGKAHRKPRLHAAGSKAEARKTQKNVQVQHYACMPEPLFHAMVIHKIKEALPCTSTAIALKVKLLTSRS